MTWLLRHRRNPWPRTLYSKSRPAILIASPIEEIAQRSEALSLSGTENPFRRDFSKIAEDLDVAGAPQSRFGVVNTKRADSVIRTLVHHHL